MRGSWRHKGSHLNESRPQLTRPVSSSGSPLNDGLGLGFVGLWFGGFCFVYLVFLKVAGVMQV